MITQLSTPTVDDQASAETRRLQFRQASSQGFGDRNNTWAWSMIWWQGRLYVGTNRAWLCAERAAVQMALPSLAKTLFSRYPPKDPDVNCAPDPRDLPLQAEIWRWTPETDRWERVYQSPRDVVIRGRPDKYVAHEVGFRYMTTFVEPDGTEALYVAGVNSEFIFGLYDRVEQHIPPPRLLRSVDGVTFTGVPQEPGTLMGGLEKSSLRTLLIHNNHLFVIGGAKIYGDGVLLEASNPASGNNDFKQVSPPGMRIFEVVPFNGYLYLGLRDTQHGYGVVKTDASGSPPYTFTPVITHGAFLSPPSQSVISMYVYQGKLYVGTDRPAELIRINADDTWELVAGTPRETPAGWKYPISGLDAGFTTWFNGHIWRMQEYDGRLYIGTMNMSTTFREVPKSEPLLAPNYGFDLFETQDGWHYAPVTLSGFGDKFNFGLRSFADTPHGLFIGTTNSWYGLQIWRGTHAMSDEQHASVMPPKRLEVECTPQGAILSWEFPPSASRFRIWRARVNNQRHAVEANPLLAGILRILRYVILPFNPQLYLPPLPQKLWIPEAYAEIGTTKDLFFEDRTIVAEQRYLYYVTAEGASGARSAPSNIVAVPALSPPITIASLLASYAADEEVRGELRKAQDYLRSNSLRSADELLRELARQLTLKRADKSEEIASADLLVRLTKLQRRFGLCMDGHIPASMLE